jgi:lipoprotein-anchoring transpeptidase ErfK/SrfK
VIRRAILLPAVAAVAGFLALANPPTVGTKRRPLVRYDLQTVNNPAAKAPLKRGDKGPVTLRAQIFLSRAHFSVGQIDGFMGTNTVEALAGFEQAHGLPVTQAFTEAVWQALNVDQGPALISYTVDAEDLKGPFVDVPEDMMAKAKLMYLGYASPLDELGEKFHVNPNLLQALNPRAMFQSAGEAIMVPNVDPPLEAQAARVVVSKSHATVTAYDDSGKVIAQYPCTTGSEHDPLPIGYWEIRGVYRNPHFNYDPNLFWDADDTQAKARIAPGPRNPVGTVWIDLSKQHYGIHGAPDPSTIGHTQSHGCIRLTNWDAMELAGMVKKGTPAVLTE